MKLSYFEQQCFEPYPIHRKMLLHILVFWTSFVVFLFLAVWRRGRSWCFFLERLQHLQPLFFFEDQIRVATQLYAVLQQLNEDEEDDKVLSGSFINLIEDTGTFVCFRLVYFFFYFLFLWGLKKDDPRLVEIFHRLDAAGGLRKDIVLSVEDFIEIIKGVSKFLSI